MVHIMLHLPGWESPPSLTIIQNKIILNNPPQLLFLTTGEEGKTVSIFMHLNRGNRNFYAVDDIRLLRHGSDGKEKFQAITI